MTGMMRAVATDVLVVGGGAAGIAAAITARRNGAEAILVEAGPMLGGELVLGLPLAGMFTAQGQRAVGGFADEFLECCAKFGSEVVPLRDHHARTLMCLDPEASKLAAIELTHGAGVRVLMYTAVDHVARDGDGGIEGVILRNKAGRTLVRARVVVDATEDGRLAALAGCPRHGPAPETVALPPLVFRMAGVDAAGFLDHLGSAPDWLAAPASPAIAADRAAAAKGLRRQGRVIAELDPAAPPLREAMAAGRMVAAAGLGIAQTSAARRDVVIRLDRVARLDAAAIDRAADIETCANFLRSALPGFAGAVISAVHPWQPAGPPRPVEGTAAAGTGAGPEAVALGCHGPQDVATTGDGSFAIPFGCLMPQGLRNLLVIGGALSVPGGPVAGVRASGTGLALGQAAGTAAALTARTTAHDLRGIEVSGLHRTLREQGAILAIAG